MVVLHAEERLVVVLPFIVSGTRGKTGVNALINAVASENRHGQEPKEENSVEDRHVQVSLLKPKTVSGMDVIMEASRSLVDALACLVGKEPAVSQVSEA